MKNRMLQFWRTWCWPLLLIALSVSSLRSAVADWNDVPTGSMKPTILEGDRIFVNKLAYDLKVPFTTWHLAQWDDPRRGDIVVFFSPADGKRLVKRVIGIPGDLIAMRNNRLSINGEAIRYEPLDDELTDHIAGSLPFQPFFYQEELDGNRHPVMFTPALPSRHSFGPHRVPSGQYFVMGDNRNNSADSRYFGFVGREQIVGQATSVVLSLQPRQHYYPRWNRFFKKLP